MSRRIIEAYCAGDAIVFPGSGPTLRLARGWHLTVPELRMSSNRARNHWKACVVLGLKTLPEGSWVQLQWNVSNDFGERFTDYAQATPANAPTAVQRLRNLKAIQMLEAAKAGK